MLFERVGCGGQDTGTSPSEASPQRQMRTAGLDESSRVSSYFTYFPLITYASYVAYFT